MESEKEKGGRRIRRTQQLDQEKCNGEMGKLPDEIIFNILSNLPIKSVLQCRCVCKSWLAIIRDPQFADAHLARSSTAADWNIILWHRSFEPSSKLYLVEDDTFKISNEISWIRKVCESLKFSEFNFVGSRNGLICLSQPWDYVPVYVLNPLTRQYMELPPLTQPTSYNVVLGFGFASNTNEYKVLRIISIDEAAQVEVYTLGTGCWRSKDSISYSLNLVSDVDVFLNGALHWISFDTYNPMVDEVIVSFDVGDEEFRVIPTPPVNVGAFSWYVGVIEGSLSVRNYSLQGCIEIWIMKDYGVKESWSKYFVFPEKRYFFPLDIPRNGQPILGFCPGKLITYDVGSQRLTDLQLYQVPYFDLAFPYVASLITLESACGGEKMSEKERSKIKVKKIEQLNFH